MRRPARKEKHPHLRTVAIGSAIEKAPQAESVEWQLKGLCRSKRYNPDMWSPFENHERRALLAKDVCVQCPVLQQCREWALSHHEEHGVWGGLSEGDRQRLWTGKTPIRRYRKNTIAAFGEIVSGDQPHG
jgi:WhiB family redox-sensing transcriptional regulator